MRAQREDLGDTIWEITKSIPVEASIIIQIYYLYQIFYTITSSDYMFYDLLLAPSGALIAITAYY